MRLTRPSAWLFRAEAPDKDAPAWKPLAAALADCLAILAAVGVACWAIVDTGGYAAAWGALGLAGFAALVSWVTFGITLGGVRTLLPLYQATAATQSAQKQLDFASRALQAAEIRLGEVQEAMRADGEALRASTGALTESTRTLEGVRDRLAAVKLPVLRPAEEGMTLDEMERMMHEGEGTGDDRT